MREPRKPSWRRALTMGGVFIVLLLFLTSSVGKHNGTLQSRIMLAVVYGGLGILFFYLDRPSRVSPLAEGHRPGPEA